MRSEVQVFPGPPSRRLLKSTGLQVVVEATKNFCSQRKLLGVEIRAYLVFAQGFFVRLRKAIVLCVGSGLFGPRPE